MSLEVLSVELFNAGYMNDQGETFTTEEVQDLIDPLLNTNQDYSNDGFGSCGINRDKNPCGDASDY